MAVQDARPVPCRCGHLCVWLAMMLVSLAGCTHHGAHHYAQAAFVTGSDSYPVILPGTDDVLRYDYSRMLLPIPDAYSGWSFLVSLRPALVRPATTLTLPHEEVKATVLRLRAPSVRTAAAPAGAITVISVTPTEIEALIDLACPALDWSYRGKVRFSTELSPSPSARSLPTDGLILDCIGPAPPVRCGDASYCLICPGAQHPRSS